MSDDPKPQGSDPQNQRKQNENPSFNWRVIILFGIALGLLLVAYMGMGKGKGSSLTYSQFEALMENHQVVRNSGKYRLEVLTSESYFNAEISGWHTTENEPVSKPVGDPVAVKVRTNLGFEGERIRNLIGDFAKNAKNSTGDELPAADEISMGLFEEYANQNEILREAPHTPLITTAPDTGEVVILAYHQPREALNDEQLGALETPPVKFRVPVNGLAMEKELNVLFNNNVPYRENSKYLRSVLISFLPILILIILLFFLFRHQMKAAGRGAMNFGKSKARLLSMDRNKVTFNDVAGIQEAKEELWEIVDYLKDPRKFQKLGGNIPKGILMVGAPGTGKTLLARAIAGEANVPFFSISGSDFVEMFVGVGASRVRDMFEQGKKSAPCLIFIDEIDAVGRHRGHGMGGGHDEREQTLNALLVEMDGFDTQEGIIIIAATNRPDVLDPALLRPGRFDRQVTVSLPDVNGRAEILQVHAKKIKLAAGVDLSVIAKGTPGFSGAELANLINEAALLSARKGLKAVTLTEMEEARDKVRWGRERRSLALSAEDKLKTAYHEAGHAILNEILDHTDPLHKVTIIPRGPSLGSTMFLPESDKFSYHRKEMVDQLIVLMGGRVAEEVMLDDVASGASGDIHMATSLARRMVCEWGMSDKMGMIEYGDNSGGGFLARDMMSQTKNYSEATAQQIDAEIKRFIDEAYSKAQNMLNQRRELLELIAQALMEFETLEARHIQDLINHGEMKDPPKPPEPPELPADKVKADSSESSEKATKDDDGTLPPEVVGAPA